MESLNRDSPDEPRTDVNGSSILYWLETHVRGTAGCLSLLKNLSGLGIALAIEMTTDGF